MHLGTVRTNSIADAKADEKQYLLSAASTSSAAPLASKTNGSKKRAASSAASPTPSQEAAKKPKIVEDAKVGDGKNAKSKTLAVELDEYCPLSSYRVYIDSDGTIWDASLNQTNASANNNKFYKVQVCLTLTSLSNALRTSCHSSLTPVACGLITTGYDVKCA